MTSTICNSLVWLMVTWNFLARAPVSALEPTPSLILKFPLDSTTSYVKLQTTFARPLGGWTICYRVRPSHLNTENPVFAYSTAQSKHELLLSYTIYGIPQAWIKDKHFYANPQIPRANFVESRWDHVCVDWGMHYYFHMRTRKGNNYWVVSVANPIQPGGEIVLGQDPATFLNSANVFHGDLTDLHMWDYVLPDEKVEEYFRCNLTLQGNVISWNNLPMKLVNVITEYAPGDTPPYCF